ncbi:peptide/nickel transport system permease protein [Butyrivibrio fibrisolvens]|uniref:Peptide/nickel transport system permease protein n=1 Tax=Butyrivibrio fibrisolvens TaxID=831 RepID=A0A1H9P3D0_BUTFI|nr:ABC transporter permease [Butyrivibrio fibrisolvens]SER42688.1 peptide/nickel transport system permease protein [Butyrivibrio fibrisolvens]
MKKYLIKRTGLAIGIIIAISMITFLILNIIPGDPVALMLGDMASPETIEKLREQMGLNRPLPEQYVNWILQLITGDLGNSYFQKKPVLELIGNAFYYTSRLALFAYIIALVIGITSGVVAAVFHGKLVDRILMTIAIAGISAPAFWVAILLQIYIALNFDLFPVSGVSTMAGYVLPSIALGSRYAASIARITRTSMLETMNQDFIRTARAKGLGSFRIVVIHAFRNALLPIITVIGADIGSLLAGAMLTESVFNIPGIGKLLIDAINKRDLPIVQGTVMYIAIICVLIYLVVDILYAVIDPRIKLGDGTSG